MFNARFLRKMRFAVLSVCVAGGTMFTSCGLTDIRDNLISGALGGIEGAAENWVSALIIDLNEIFEATPDTPIDTP